MTDRLATVAAMWLVVAGCVTGRPRPESPPRHTNLALEITHATLANGLRVVAVRDARASEIQVTMRYAVGAVNDPPGREGMAHLVEHLMFQQVVGGQSIFARLEADATYFNAETSLDATTYVVRAPVDRLDELLSIESVRVGLRCRSINDAVFAREREVVLNELKLRDGPSELLRAVRAGLYPEGHAYRRTEGGSDASVSAITREEACAFADTYYTPGNAAIVISGPIPPERLEASLGKFLARAASRASPNQVSVPNLSSAGSRTSARAPIDDDAVLVAWPLPADPKIRAEVRAVAQIAYLLVDNSIRGHVELGELGDMRAPVLALLVAPSSDETLEQARTAAERAIGDTPLVFDGAGGRLQRVLFERTKQAAIAEVFGTLEEGSGRDARLAAYALAGRNPSEAVEEEMAGLRAMTRDDAAEIARTYLRVDHATILTLQHAEKRGGRSTRLAPPIHELGRRRDRADPAIAHQPVPGNIDRHAFNGMRTRTLPNGLRVVLLPITSVPVVNVRLVFGAGTSDEPLTARGAALVAADALTWGPQDIDDLLLFAAAGGDLGRDVGTDATTFSARGVDMHVDLLLSGIARLVRDGMYGADAAAVVSAMRRQDKRVDDEGKLTDEWRSALFGSAHPYAEAGLVRHASKGLRISDARAFHDAYYTPDNATLVIAGKFDADVADQWIDYLFTDWQGKAHDRAKLPTSMQPVSLARADDTSQVAFSLAMRASAGSRAAKLVAAEMLDEIASDVRFQLGASYAMNAGLEESRLAMQYTVAGYVDRARIVDAVGLIRDRLAELRADPDAAAAAFVAARQRTLLHLLSVAGSSRGMAERVQRDVELGLEPLSDVATAEQVKTLTIESLAPALAELDIANAAILMRGPEADVRGGFSALGREPHFIEKSADSVASRTVAHDAADAPIDPPTREEELAELEHAQIARDYRPSAYAFVFAPGYTSGHAFYDASGVSVAADAGIRDDDQNSFGIHASIGDLSGTYVWDKETGAMAAFRVIPIDLALYARASAYDRLWGEVALGVNIDRESDAKASRTDVGVAIVLEAGIDVWKHTSHHVGIYGRIDREMAGAANYEVETVGLAYRR